MATLESGAADAFAGTARVPGDKSISHRALILAALAVGRTTITGLLESADTRATADALRAFGAAVDRREDGVWTVDGVGVGGLAEPGTVIDFGNSGTSARLLLGAAASHPITCFMTGDASLRGRPMGRVIAPARMIGAEIVARADGRLPLAVTGAEEAVPIAYEPPVASAQVKSAVLLAGLNAPGRTVVVEKRPTRDHTELMLRHFGVDVAVEERRGKRVVTVAGHPEIEARPVEVPGDFSSAAFLGVAALLVPGARVRVPGVGLNPTRTGLLDCLAEMGAEMEVDRRPRAAGEPVADLTFHGGPAGALSGIEVPAERAPRMIDEYPILAMAAAAASGTTRMHGLAELRVKESDRLAALASGLAAAGAGVEIDGDTLSVAGRGGPVPGGVRLDCRLDHRIAMSFLALGLAAEAPIEVTGAETVGTSFPGFAQTMNGLGARIREAGRDG